jgi:hypothetical protein
MTLELWLICGGLILGGFGFFYVLAILGERSTGGHKVSI